MGEQTREQLILWMRGMVHEGCLQEGKWSIWRWYQGIQGHTYLGKKLLGCWVGLQAAVDRMEAAMVGLGGGIVLGGVVMDGDDRVGRCCRWLRAGMRLVTRQIAKRTMRQGVDW